MPGSATGTPGPAPARGPRRFIAGFCCDGLIAPWVLGGAMNRASLEGLRHAPARPAPALRPGQIVVADNLSSHTSGPAVALLRGQGNDPNLLPPGSPDLNPAGMAFSRLKTLIRKAAARTCEALWKEVGAACDPCLPQECRNCFVAAGYGSN